jgi:class 3 adenylate cyclase
MTEPRLEGALQGWAEHLERLNWSGLILDPQTRLVYVSSQARAFVQTKPDADLGEGRHIIEAFLLPTWLDTVSPEYQLQMFQDLAPFMLSDFKRQGLDIHDVLPEQFLPLLDQVVPIEPPLIWSSSFAYINPAGDGELPDYKVNVCFLRLHDERGELLGWLGVFFMAVRPNLLALLARGDEEMYERMARLVEPAPHQAAVFFCDLHRSGRLSRQLPSSIYFKLVRRLWTGFDAAVAEHKGIIGKHAGDGASAFFLVDDLGSPSKAAAEAIGAAKAIHEISESVFREVVDSECLMKVGIHWGGSLYMGQLVPGGRLDVTALGDEVNEAARIQETAGPGETLVSKQLVEQLYPEDALSLGLDLEKLLYQPLSNLATASEKAIKDAGGIAVTTLSKEP